MNLLAPSVPSEFIDKITSHLGPLSDVFRLHHFHTCVSTNTVMMEHPPIDDGYIHVLVADEQTGGRGRRGRTWLSWATGSLTFSLLWRFTPNASAPAGLSLAVGVALAETLEALDIHGIQLKWPNDVMINGKKIAGILIELIPQRRHPPAAVIGIGINLKLPDQTFIPNQPAVTDLFKASEQSIERSTLLANILKKLYQTLKHYEINGFSSIQQAWQQRNAFANLPVKISDENNEIIGSCIGVDTDGALLLLCPEKSKRPIRILSGEVSLRGHV